MSYHETMKHYTLFSGTGNERLSHEVVKPLHKDLGKLEIVTFADSEKRVRVEEEVTDKLCFVIASLTNPVDTHLVELCLIADALKSNDCGKLVAVIPYYGYARQDRAHRPGEGVSARVMARLIEAVDIDKVITVDLHSELVAGYFNIGMVELSAQTIFAQKIKEKYRDVVVVSPDAGGAKRAQHFAELLDAPLTFMEKKRDLNKLHDVERLQFIGEAKGKTAVLIDDVVTTGSTLVKAAYTLKDHGVKAVVACVTHADFVEGTHKVLEDSPLDKVYVTDTIPKKPENRFAKLEMVSVAPLLAEQIKKMV